MHTARTEESPVYLVGSTTKDWEDETIATALAILEKRVGSKDRTPVTSPEDLRNLLRLKLGALDYEVFGCVFLDSQHNLLSIEYMFRGTLSQTSVYPREVVKESLNRSASAVIFFHNHPSGLVRPSTADEKLTSALKSALSLVDVRVLDHVIVSSSSWFSFAQSGLL